MGYAGNYKSGYAGGYLTEPADVITRVENVQESPALKVEIAFEPFGQPLVWNDVSAYVDGNAGFTINRGRSGELDSFNVGTASLLLRNEDGRFDPDNASGPYYPNLVPRRQVRISATIGSGATPFTMMRSWVGGDDVLRGTQAALPTTLIVGDSGSFDRTWGPEGQTAVVALEVAEHGSRLDAPVPPTKDPITNQEVPILVTGTTGDAVVQLLGLFGWPGVEGTTAPMSNEFMDVEVGTVSLVPESTPIGNGTPITGTYIEALRKLAVTEGGEFFISREGKATFRSGDSIGANAGVWGDEGNLPYAALASRPADELLINEVTIHQTNNVKTTVADAESIFQYGKKSKTFEVFQINAPALPAFNLLGRYSQPRERIVGFEPLGKQDVAFWRSILPRDFTDRMQFQLHPPYGGVIDRTLRIEGISITSPNRFDWRVSWSASEVPDAEPNLLPDEQGDFENGPHAWLPIDANSSASVFDVTGAGPPRRPHWAPHGIHVLRVVADSSTNGAYTDFTIPETGDYLLTGFFWSAFGGTLRVQWLDAVGSLLQTDQASLGHSFTTFAFGELATTAPSGSVTARIAYLPGSTGGFLDALELRRG